MTARIPEPIDAIRDQVAGWYETRATEQAAIGRGALASLWLKFADRVRSGDADHRLNAIANDQADYDRAEKSA